MSSFWKGTTPTHTFDFASAELNPSDMAEITITYKQNNKIVLQKKKADLTIDEYKVIYKLTVDETKLFTAKEMAKVQIVVDVDSTTRIASGIYTMSVNKILSEV